jgi:hypothetical protein
MITALGGPACQSAISRHRQRIGDIVRRYSKLAHTLPYLRERSNDRSVEEVRESLEEEATDSPRARANSCQCASTSMTCFQGYRIKWLAQTNDVTNYAPLIREIRRFSKSAEPVCLVTFNYDLLLDRNAQCSPPSPSLCKTRPGAPSSVHPARSQLLGILKSVTKVLMIGWQAREAHFLQMLRDNLPGRGG